MGAHRLPRRVRGLPRAQPVHSHAKGATNVLRAGAAFFFFSSLFRPRVCSLGDLEDAPRTDACRRTAVSRPRRRYHPLDDLSRRRVAEAAVSLISRASSSQEDYAAECAISSRPFTVFRWRPGNEARYKKTVVCREIALAKNVCQVCLLDLDYGIPVQARDAALGREREMLAKSDVNIEYQTEQMAKKLANGEETYADSGVGKARANELLNKLARKRPYYNKNKAPICTFWLRNACNRADCPYRPCNGDTNMPELTSAPELRQQNIKDRYYGINDPVAEKMLKRAEEMPTLKPPEDASITTLYVGGMDERVDEAALKDVFYAHGELKSIRCVHARNCAFVTYTDRAGAEKAAEALGRHLVVNGIKLRLMWGKPKKDKGEGGAASAAASGSRGGATALGPVAGPAAAGGGAMPPMMGAMMGGVMPPMMMGAPGGMMGAPPAMMMMPQQGAGPGGMQAPVMGYVPMQVPMPYQPPMGAAGGGAGGRGMERGNNRQGAGGAAVYPSMDPAAMGTRRVDPATDAQKQQQPRK